MRTCGRKSFLSTKVNEAGERERAADAGADIPLQSVVQIVVRQKVPMQNLEVHVRPEIYPQTM